jgi:hypothetical protein
MDWVNVAGYVRIPPSVLGTVAIISAAGGMRSDGASSVRSRRGLSSGSSEIGFGQRSGEVGRSQALRSAGRRAAPPWDALGVWLLFGPPIAVFVAIVATAALLAGGLLRSRRRRG